MNLQNLSDIHTGRYAQRVQYDIQRTSVRKERHILYRKYTGNDTLVTMTASHLIADGNLSLLCNVDANGLIYARRQLVAVLSGKYLGINDDTVRAVRYLQGGITNLSCLLTEDRAQQALLCGQLGLSLRGYLTYQDITGTNLCTDADDTALVQIFQCILADTRNISCDLFRSQLGITGFCLIFLNMDGGVYILLNQTLSSKERHPRSCSLPRS